MGAESPNRLAYAVLLPSQCPLDRAIYSPCRNGDKQSNDSASKLLLQKDHLDTLHHPVYLCHLLRCHVRIFATLLDKPGRRLVSFNPLQQCLASTRPPHQSPGRLFRKRRDEKTTVTGEHTSVFEKKILQQLDLPL